jgi:DNA-binding XRE family transcriptional regulator
MKDRLQEILTRERLSPARFAELVGVQRSSVSHILSGRNKPSLDFLQKTLTHFGHINPDWLISGNGTYKRSGASIRSEIAPSSASNMVSGRIHFPTSDPVKEEDPVVYTKKAGEKGLDSEASTENSPETGKELTTPLMDTKAKGNREDKTPPAPPKQIVKTILFYNDRTFEVFHPA